MIRKLAALPALLPITVLLPPLLLAPGQVLAQDSTGSLFADTTPLVLRFTGPFRQLSSADEERPEHDATLEYQGADGAAESVDVEIRVRGRSRLTNCDFPPLSLDFPRAAVEGTLFAGQNRLKLVTLCKSGTSYVEYLAKEFLIYRMWNELTENSFRVRWANVEYIYTDSNRDRTVFAPAFLIEGDGEVAERLALDVIEMERLGSASLDTPHTTLLAMFQYLIGNTDFDLRLGPEGEPCCHNGKVIGSEGGPYIVVPYDFDNAGLIAAEYAVPNEILPIRSVTQRLYRGFCAMNDEIEGAIETLNGRRDSVIGILDDALLSERGRERAVDYLSESFEMINDPRQLENQIYGRCLQ